MIDKKTRQFFQLTEQSIRGESLAADTFNQHAQASEEYKNKRIRYLVLVGLLMMLCTLYFWQSNKIATLFPWFNLQSLFAQKENDALFVQKNHVPSLLAMQAEKRAESYLKSQIPVFHLAAKRQILEAVPLRRAELLVMGQNDEDNQNASMVVMDKVIVMPKMILSNVTQVA